MRESLEQRQQRQHQGLNQQRLQVDKQGSVNTARILNLRTLKIDDEKWLRAMQAISDSMKVASTKPYIRFYELDERSGDYVPISLDVAAL